MFLLPPATEVPAERPASPRMLRQPERGARMSRKIRIAAPLLLVALAAAVYLAFFSAPPPLPQATVPRASTPHSANAVSAAMPTAHARPIMLTPAQQPRHTASR
jgi:hypothetical protein